MIKKYMIGWLSILIIMFSVFSVYAAEYEKEQQVLLEVLNSQEEENDRTLVGSSFIVKERRKEELKAIEEKKKEEEEKKYIDGLVSYITSVNNNVSESTAKNYIEVFLSESKKYKIDEKILIALAQKESCFYNDATSSEDYKGLMQTGDGIARNAGYSPKDLYNGKVSIKVGARYLNYKLEEFGNEKLALTAYNQGSGSVNSGNYTLGYAETIMKYVEDIKQHIK